MSEHNKQPLPREWKWTTIEEVTAPKVTQAPPEGEGEFIYVDISSIDNRLKKIVSPKALPISQTPNRARQRIQPGDVLISMTRPNLNAVALVPENLEGAIGSTGFHVLRSNDIVPQWLFYIVQSDAFISAMTSLVQGVLYPAVRPKDVVTFRIPLAPLPEQHRIVAEIETQFTRLDVSVAALKRVQANLKRYRASVLQAACEGRLVPTEVELARAEGRSYESADQLLQRILQERRMQWEGEQLADMKAKGRVPKDDKWKSKYKEPVKPDTSELPELPEGWVWTSIEQLLMEDSCNGISVKGTDEPPGIPALRLSAMSNNGFDYGDRRYIPITDVIADKLSIRHGDFFVARGNGSIRLVGRGTLAQPPPERVVFPDTMIRLRLSEEQNVRAYISTIWSSRFLRRQIEIRARTTAGIYKISQRDIDRFTIPLPPLAEQHRIVAEVERRLSVVDELDATIAANLKRTDRLRQAILKRAFEGKLVPQDPTDEPASVLLERIRAEREHEMAQPKATRQKTNAHKPTVPPKATAPVQGELALGFRE